jgi:preprotein translocase subunit SecD
VPSGVFEVRGVLEVVPSTAPDFDALEVTCINTNGTSSPGCIDAATAQGQEVVLLDVQGSAKYRLAPATLTAEDVTTADAIEIGLAGSSSWAVMIQLTPDGSTAFEELTSGLVGQRVAMVSDAIVVSAPMVQEPITSGAVQVGNLSQEDAQALAASLAPRS